MVDLLTDPSVADGILTAAEQDALRWAKPPRTVKAARFSAWLRPPGAVAARAATSFASAAAP